MQQQHGASSSPPPPTALYGSSAATSASTASTSPVDLHPGIPHLTSAAAAAAAASFHYYRKGLVEEPINGGHSHVNVRILELRKEKSRDAARSRRTKENQEFYELAKMLPLPGAITSQLDKASIIRLTMSYLKLRDFSGHGEPPWDRHCPPTAFNKQHKGRSRVPFTSLAAELFEQHHGTHILQSLDGFAFALTPDGRFLYISETVSIYLGLSQVEVTGSSVFDYVHRDDHNEIAEQLGLHNLSGLHSVPSPAGSVISDDEGTTAAVTSPTATPTSRLVDPDHDKQPVTPISIQTDLQNGNVSRSFCIRMKSTLTKRGCHFKSAGYRVVLLLSRMRPQLSFSQSRKPSQTLLGMVVLAIALPPPSVNEVRLESDMFVTRLTFELKIAHCEPRVEELIDYTADELTGRNMYTLCHGQDVHKIRKLHVDLMGKGQVMSSYYRLMNRNGGYSWVQTCATVIMNSKNSDEQTIICVNYLLSRVEFNSVVMDRSQLDEADDGNVNKPDNDRQHHTTTKDGATGSGNNTTTTNSVVTNNNPERSSSSSSSSSSISDTADYKEDIQEREPRPCTPEDLEAEHQVKNDELRDEKTIQVPHSAHSYNEVSAKEKGEVIVDESATEVSERRSTPDCHRKRKFCSASDEMTSDDPESVIKVPSCDELGHSPSPDEMSKKNMLMIQVDDADRTEPGTDKRAGLLSPWINSGQSSPASALLRHIYANRESVIRSNFAAANRPSYFSDVPPSSDSFLDQSQFLLQTKLANSAAQGYNSTTSSTTPPSSLSPRDKYQCSGGGSGGGAVMDVADVRQYEHQHVHQSFSIKPQMGGMSVASAAAAGTAPEPLSPYAAPVAQQQFGHHHHHHHHHHHDQPPSFYNAHHHHSANFHHLYHAAGLNKVPISYIDGLKNSAPWYSQSS